MPEDPSLPELSASGPLLWRIAVSPVTFVLLSICWCLDLAVGSILAYRDDPQFWMKMDAYPFNLWLAKVAPATFPQSLWVYLLVVLTYLVVLSLALCTVNWFFRRRRRRRGMGEVLIHLGFLLIFSGFVLGSGFGVRSQGVLVAEGEKAAVPGLDLELQVERVEEVRGPQGQVLDTISQVVFSAATGGRRSGEVRTNHPLIAGTTVVYPRGARRRVSGGRVAVPGLGVVPLTANAKTPLPGGEALVLAGALGTGERRGRFVGPGVLVSRLNGVGQVQGSAYLSTFPGASVRGDLAGLRVTLVDLQEQVYGVYDVHRDPGVQLVLFGAVALALGSVWALITYLGVRPAR